MTANEVKSMMVSLARSEFYYYCKFKLPKIYTDNRPHLKILCDKLQEFIESDKTKLIINMPPRHGKTLTVELLTEWVYGKDRFIGVMVACYNETLAMRFSKQVRNDIKEIKAQSNKLVYSDYFPKTKVKDGDASMQLWSLEDSHFSMLATSPGGTMTGIGAQLLIIDDLIKNADEAYNERILDEHWEWYTNTVLSRIESGGKQIIIQTRWSTKDLTGKLLKHESEKWEVIKMPAEKDGVMLCDDILNLEVYEDRKKKTDPIIIAGNYQQEPYDSVDRLYAEFKEYTIDMIPDKWERIEFYADTADKGDDYFSGSAYGVYKGCAYILDILFTTDGMEQTEIQTARMLSACKVNTAWIESNNGGEGFARNVEKRIREDGNRSTVVKPFHQGGNKVSRILANSFSVTNCIYMPKGWKERHKEFYMQVSGMGKSEKWNHDDAADMLTGIIEKTFTKNIVIL